MKKTPIIVLSIGIVIALIVSIVSYNMLKSKAQQQLQTQETVDVAVAGVDMAWGTVLEKNTIKTAPYLKRSLPAGYFTSATSLEGRVLIRPIKTNEPIFESALAPSSVKSGGMAAVVQPDKRAMTIKVDKVVGVSGFIFPGNRVDILVTLQDPGQGKGAITKTVLENMLVLATGVDIEKTGKQEKAAQVDVITLEVTPVEGENLALAATQGKLQLALRNFSDTNEVVTRGATVPVLLSSYSAGAGTKPAGKVNQKSSGTSGRSFSVELIQGSKVTNVRFE